MLCSYVDKHIEVLFYAMNDAKHTQILSVFVL